MCPYIHPEARKALRNAGTVGELTYQFQQDILKYLQQRDLSYTRIALVLGALEGVRLDFIKRVVEPYEESKRRENGDVWSPELTSTFDSYSHSD